MCRDLPRFCAVPAQDAGIGPLTGVPEPSWLERRLHSPKPTVQETTLSTAGSLVRDLPDLERLFQNFFEQTSEHGGAPPALRQWTDLAEAWRILHALRQTKGNRSEAARQLGIGRRTLYTKMDKLGIEPTFSVRS
ncbi:MAG: hypothetical protein JRH01_03295 [Deltaproteobacteria bacterium]|nr:hypothetical protein [Deltaproteobacteria bacterium]MBW2394494.1 hypothetical protein [Deltaproteobacteria bacterium]